MAFPLPLSCFPDLAFCVLGQRDVLQRESPSVCSGRESLFGKSGFLREKTGRIGAGNWIQDADLGRLGPISGVTGPKRP